MPGPGPIGQREMRLRSHDSQGILARTFPVLPGPQGANLLDTERPGACLAELPAPVPRGGFLPTSRWNCRPNMMRTCRAAAASAE